jgi:hypothetical protein
MSLLQKSSLCHPERSEGSQPSEETRFFATLRMTRVINGEFGKRLVWQIVIQVESPAKVPSPVILRE